MAVKLKYYETVKSSMPHSFEIADYTLMDRHDFLNVALYWCEDQFGACSAETWYFNPTISTFRFAQAEEAFAFRMRWC